MADEKTVVKKTGEKKPSFLSKVGGFFKRLPRTIATPFTNMWREIRKVTWPTKSELINKSLIVVLFMIFMGAVIGLLDMGSSALISAMIG